jgi:hypothetical protein
MPSVIIWVCILSCVLLVSMCAVYYPSLFVFVHCVVSVTDHHAADATH